MSKRKEKVFEEMCKGGGISMEKWREDGDGWKRRRWVEEWRKSRAEWDAHRREIMRHHNQATLPGPEFG